jgi:hypothetical protein
MTIPELQEQRTAMLAYLRMKLDANDMHAVQDAASDIREIDAKLEVLREPTNEAEAERAANPALARRIG